MTSENGERLPPRRGIVAALPDGAIAMNPFTAAACIGLVLALSSTSGSASGSDEQRVAALDTEYQAAVLKKDVAAMDRLLADDFVLVTGKGKAFSKSDLLASERNADHVYTHQEDTQQTVRVWGDTAVVTALLHVAGTDKGEPFDYSLWFSDVYLRTPKGWRYTFGQASIRLSVATPAASPKGQ
jgi:ketosteroid isomerase-like protein